MKKPSFKLNGKSYTFQDITIRKYYELMEILKTQDKDSEFEVVQCLTGCPISDLKRLPFGDWLVVWEETILQVETLKTDTNSIQPIITLNGVKFGLPAVQDISVGEFADLEIFFSQKDASTRMHEAAAMVYRPIVKQNGEYIKVEDYDAEKVKERTDQFLDAPLSAIRSANAFFLQSANSLLRNTADSLLKSKGMNWITPEDRVQLHVLTQLDLGGESSIPLAETILSNLEKQRSSRFVRRSTGSPTEKLSLKDRILRYKNKLNTK